MNKEDMKFFHEGTMRICGSLDIDEVLQDFFPFLKKYIPAEGIQLSLYEEDFRWVRVIGVASDIGLIKKDTVIPLSEEAVAYMEREKDKILIFNHSYDNPIAHDACKAIGFNDMSNIVIHLEIKNVGIGVVAIFSEHPNRFNEEHARLLGLFHNPFAIAMSNTLRFQEVVRMRMLLQDDNQYLKRELHHMSGDEIIGEHFGLKNVMEQVRQVASLNSQVLLLGETGVGKEVIANAIHYRSSRHSGPLIKVNCGAIPETLLDSELFGHEKGAFTGALARKRGRFERAHTGTIFLDEIGELPPAAQVRLLRVLENREIERVGGTETISIDARVIAATHRDLSAMVQAKEFREDLWYRLNVFPIVIPPLRHRKADIPALVSHFIGRKAGELKLGYMPVPAPGVMERVQQYDWPGNVRELENAVERELIRAQSKGRDIPLQFSEFGMASRPKLSAENPPVQPRKRLLADVEREHISSMLEMCKGKIQGKDGAAAVLGMHPSTLRHRMRKLGIDFGRRRSA